MFQLTLETPFPLHWSDQLSTLKILRGCNWSILTTNFVMLSQFKFYSIVVGGTALIAVSQMTVGSDKESNFKTCHQLIQEASSAGAKVASTLVLFKI